MEERNEKLQQAESSEKPVNRGAEEDSFWDRPLVPMTIILIIGAVLRFYKLSNPSLWLDEGHMLWIGLKPLGEIIPFVNTYELHPPLYYLFMHFWLKLGTTEFIIRIPSVVAGVAGIYAVYLMARESAGHRTALLAAAFSSFSCFEILFCQEARMYPFLLLFSSLCIYHFIRALRTGRFVNCFFFVITALLALYTDYRVIFILIAMTVWYFINIREFGLRLKTMLISAAAIVAGSVPLIPIILHQSGPQGGGSSMALFFGPPDGPKFFKSIFSLFAGNVLPLEQGLINILAFAILAVLAWGTFIIFKSKDTGKTLFPALFFLSLAGMICYSLFKARIFSVHHIIFLSPVFMCLLAAVTMETGKLQRLIIPVVVIAFLYFNLASLFLWYTSPFCQKQNFRALVSYVSSQTQPGDKIAIVPEYQAYPFMYYYRGTTPVLQLTPATMGAAERDIAESKRIWWIFAGDQVIDKKRTILEWVLNNHNIDREKSVMFPQLPYEVTGDNIQVILAEKKTK
ncbi:MAG: glycosyltransferase family 39 protein [Firmicutes bacterium]|nr:glycosyltransferase family 39 protein [Bacillota bacterium]